MQRYLSGHTTTRSTTTSRTRKSTEEEAHGFLGIRTTNRPEMQEMQEMQEMRAHQ